MTRFQFIIKSFLHYLKANLLVALGVAISTAVLTGGLIIGDSITFSLEQITNLRLGRTAYVVSTAGRYFRQGLAQDMENNSRLEIAPALISEAVALTGGGAHRANRVQVIGIDNSFEKIAQTNIYSGLKRNEAVISENLAARLSVSAGDNILLRIKKARLIPLNAPFVSDEESSVAVNITVKAIATKDELGRFSLKNSQTAPFNVFMPIRHLNRLMGFERKANKLLIAGGVNSAEIQSLLQKHWKPGDANLIFRQAGVAGEVEVLSERVFIENRVYEAYGALPGARGVLTYFVNGIEKGKGPGEKKEAPYSFVSTVSENELSPDGIIINQWLSDDLGAKTGDTLRLKYFVIGPLRQLKEETTPFVVKKVVGMHSRYADKTLMPFFPGLSDAGHCSEWEAGVPIDLGKVRSKDEDYWDEYKGTPKAFISIKTALGLWSNRFGDYTSIRFDKGGFDKAEFEKIFAGIPPSALGFSVAAVKDEGRLAAQNGVDFSQLFIGLSFFLLVAAILLAWLLFLLNLETRFSQIGTLSTLGFTSKQVKSIFLAEGAFVSIAGSLIGLVLAVSYTQIVFNYLNSLWYDIVRTNILEIKLLPKTLFTGFLISNLITILVINFSIRKKLKQQAADIQKKITTEEKKWVARVKWVAAILSLFSAIIIVFSQLIFSDSQNPSLFFMSGGLMLFSLLLFSGRILQYVAGRKAPQLSILGLSIRNTVRNRNRSLTIIILFALGTFLVISTGANRQDMFADAYEKASGTGGFLYFAETTMPIPFNMNDKAKRVEEGLSEDFSVVQLRKVEGDDASCLNLNRVSNPTILGVNPGELEGRFSFVKSPPGQGQGKPWQSLNQEPDGGVVPAIADQTVILWGLGKKVGDTLNYLNETGDTLRLKLIGGLDPSIFQGYVIIGNNHFLENFPTSSGSSVFLIDGDPEKSEKIAKELYLNFRDYGWEMAPAPQRLAEFYSVTNTYLSIFLALGALGLALGTIGLAIVLARSMLERKNEIALMKAVGFPDRKIFNVVAREYTGLLSTGVLIGLLAAILATLPSLTSANTGISVNTILAIVLAILANGFIWVVLLTSLSLKNKKLILALKNE